MQLFADTIYSYCMISLPLQYKRSGQPKIAACVHRALDAADGNAQDQAKCMQLHDVVPGLQLDLQLLMLLTCRNLYGATLWCL